MSDNNQERAQPMPEPASASASASTSSAAPGDDPTTAGPSPFACNVCFETANNPVVTLCGHLFCWACLYRWLEIRQTCPVCKSGTTRDSVVPLYAHGKETKDPRTQAPPREEPSIPRRPAGQRTEPPPRHQAPLGAPFFQTAFGNVHFQAGFGFPGLWGFQMAAGQPAALEPMTPELAQRQMVSRLLFMFGLFLFLALFLF